MQRRATRAVVENPALPADGDVTVEHAALLASFPRTDDVDGQLGSLHGLRDATAGVTPGIADECTQDL
jgi:hypothetical protein